MFVNFTRPHAEFSPMTDSILYSLAANGVATLTLNRPELHNAIDDALIARLSELLDEVQANPDVRVLVLTGNGLSFSSGVDQDWMRRMQGYSEAEHLADAQALTRVLHKLDTLRLPTIASVQGSAFGVGAGLVACCDVAVATAEALFGFSEVRLGLIPASTAPYVVRAIGERPARRYFITAERFNAEKAKRLGLVHIVVEHEALNAQVTYLTETLVRNGPHAIAGCKALLRDVWGKVMDQRLVDFTAERIAHARASDEGREGVAALLEKRKPNWQA